MYAPTNTDPRYLKQKIKLKGYKRKSATTVGDFTIFQQWIKKVIFKKSGSIQKMPTAGLI